MRKSFVTISVCMIGLVVAALTTACGGGSSSGNTNNPNAPTNVIPGSIGATISITAAGVNPGDVRIEVTQRVRIVNNDTRPHQLNTNPHNFHTDCPANNTIVLNPNQSVDTGIFGEVKACGYHDHLLPDEQKYWGVIRVGTSEDTRGPVYSKGW